MIRFAEIFYVFHVLIVLVGSIDFLPDPITKIGLESRSRCRSLLLHPPGYPMKLLWRIKIEILMVAGANSCNGLGLLIQRVFHRGRVSIMKYVSLT